MRLYLIGQKAFGVAVLERALRQGHQVVGVATPASNLLWKAANARGLPTHTTALASGDIPDGTDLIVCAHAHAFVGADVRARARGGAIGYHPSLLPLHRGRDAVRWAVHMRERVTGGTVYVMDDGVDTGPVLAQRHAFIQPGETPAELWRRSLLPLGLDLLGEVLEHLDHAVRNGRLQERIAAARPQDEQLATWEPSWERARLERPEVAP